MGENGYAASLIDQTDNMLRCNFWFRKIERTAYPKVFIKDFILVLADSFFNQYSGKMGSGNDTVWITVL